jgi:hypothetical protein
MLFHERPPTEVEGSYWYYRFTDADGIKRERKGISDLVSSGVSVKTCQSLARHSTPSLTIAVYAKASLHDIKGAVENLPDPTPRESAPEPLAMIGTDPIVTPISERFGHYLATGGDGSGRSESVSDVMTGSDSQSPMDQNPLEMTGLDASGRDVSVTVGSAPHRTRTYNPLIKSRVLRLSVSGLCVRGCDEVWAAATFQDLSGFSVIFDGFPEFRYRLAKLGSSRGLCVDGYGEPRRLRTRRHPFA